MIFEIILRPVNKQRIVIKEDDNRIVEIIKCKPLKAIEVATKILEKYWKHKEKKDGDRSQETKS